MLYEKNVKNDNLDKALFKNPTSEYRGTPFWAWNCVLEEKELLRQIDIFKEMGLGGYHIHVRTGMSTDYLSKEFMNLVKSCNEHGKQQGMLTWLYDEDRWPSGAAGGIVTKDHKYRQRYIRFTTNTDINLSESDVLVARFDIFLDENKCLSSYKKLSDGENAVGTEWIVIREIAKNSPWFNNQAYLDTLNPEAVAKFIESTHDKYYENFKDEFSKSIPAIFTDEPQFSRKSVLPFADSKNDVTLPWTDNIEETFTAKYGYSLIDNLPQLLWDLPNGEPSRVRYHYHDHVCDRFTQAFADTCGNWCQEHNIALTGHMMEEQTLLSQTSALGEAMRSYRSFSIPGIDMLCAGFEFNTAKQCQSAVHQYGRPGAMSELYGVTGWDFDFRGHKLHGDWQAALGVTVRVPHLSWVSMHGNAKRDYPASIHYQSSWYKEYNYIEDHFSRVATAMTRGTPIVRVGVIHPIESYWLHWGADEQTNTIRSAMEENFTNLTSWLLRGCIDFDFISESLFPELCGNASAPIKVGKMEYDVIIVPECETLRSTTLERLEAFREAGGKLIFMGAAPKYENAEHSTRGVDLYSKANVISFNRAALLSELDAYRSVEIRFDNGALSNNLIHQLRQDVHGKWLFLSHCDEPYNKNVAHSNTYKIKFKGKYTPELWDTLSGDIKPINFEYVNGNTVITITLYDYDSALIYLSEEGSTPCSIERSKSYTEIKNIPESVAYSLSEPNVLLLDKARFALGDDALENEEEILRLDSILRKRLGLPLRVSAVAQPWVIEKKMPRWKITLEYTFESEIEFDGAVLALEDPDVTEIIFNGENVKYEDIGFYTDVSIRKTALPKIKLGKNTLILKMPFDESTDVEACYILGDFGVKVMGRHAKITALPEKLYFDQLSTQNLPFYGGAVSYDIPLELDEECNVSIKIPHYCAAVITVEIDGVNKKHVAFPPYCADLGRISAGKHTVTVKAYISRHNCFGNIHCADHKLRWIGPDCWRTTGSSWTYEYRLLPEGILSTPIFTKTN